MKKIKNLNSIIFLILTCLFVTPTLCKYTYSKVDVASTLHFTSLTPTDIFVIEDDIIVDNNGNVKEQIADEAKWGINAEDNPSDADKDKYNFSSLTNVMFTINNKSSRDLLVTFYVEIQSNLLGNTGTFQATVNNLITGDSLVGNLSFELVGEQQLFQTEPYAATLNPKDGGFNPPTGSTKTKDQVVADSFTVYSSSDKGSTSAKYQLKIDIDTFDYFFKNYYLSVYMIVIPLN